ncbi:Astra associated protein 1 Asa1 [Lithohypha guttulata]|uniref:ASTRA-associated protein 1 n=1 Tax=Lithohypha guttulata TaxID=1690604 RepID=A0AAN7YGC9_9EURO|nr:Astra associated protein 1 Asa1 [Lithohypha guttulata]KAK5085577.1 Astra associated protein 1 Asa1 [Lithohypha guttulata]KAK5103542.1 Astra associated protein 1 Asa1 [Lithohypha guttulata]
MLTSKQAPSYGPPTPAYIFRGHQAAIHALHFFASNRYFISGDSDGWIVVWRLITKRPAAVWKAHDGGVMGIKDWQGSSIITHGRDHKLRVWRVRDEDLESLSTRLPVDGAAAEENKQPWLVHSIDVNALNFCAFAICPDIDRTKQAGSETEFPPLLLAAPNGLDNGGVDVFQFPTEQRVSKLQSEKKVNTGMVMSLRLFNSTRLGRLMLVVGYEDGQVAAYTRKNQNVMPAWIWERLMISRPHKQPVLSLDVSPEHDWFITSSADATIVKYSIPSQPTQADQAEKTNDTKHAGQQDLKIRSDGRVFATAGWDKHIRIYSAKTLKELAVLQWHKEGCYAIGFAVVNTSHTSSEDRPCAVVQLNAMERIKQEREDKIHNTHWLVAGSKDGKISLWDIY